MPWDQLPELRPHTVDIGADSNVHHRQHAVVAAIQGEAGGPHLLAQDIDRTFRNRQHVGDLGIADQRLADRPVDRDDLAFVDRNLQRAGMDACTVGGLGQGRR